MPWEEILGPFPIYLNWTGQWASLLQAGFSNTTTLDTNLQVHLCPHTHPFPKTSGHREWKDWVKRQRQRHCLHQLGEEMFKHQYNTFNSLKKNMATLEPSDPTRRLEHHNPEETKESNLNYNVIKVIESLKELMKIPLKNWRENQTKFWEKSKNLLKSKKSRRNN